MFVDSFPRRVRMEGTTHPGASRRVPLPSCVCIYLYARDKRTNRHIHSRRSRNFKSRLYADPRSERQKRIPWRSAKVRIGLDLEPSLGTRHVTFDVTGARDA